MNIKKGLFRLTLVLSILAGIILPFSMRERYPYTIYEVRREKGEGLKQLTVIFEWYGKGEPGPLNFNQIFSKAEKFKSKNMGEKVDLREEQEKSPNHEDIIWDKTPNWELYQEAYKRGILPPEKKELYDEAIKRGLVPKEFLPPRDLLADKEKQDKLAEEWKKATPIDKIDREKLPTYTILKKTVNPIKWNKSFYKMAIGFTSGFISIWVIYAFIRWVIVFFIIGGFKSKTTQ